MEAAAPGVESRARDFASAVGLVEREAELQALTTFLDDVVQGEGRMLAFEAPAGMGKSALAHHAIEAARARGLTAVSAAGRELERLLGWGTVRTLFEPSLGRLDVAERGLLLAGPASSARLVLEPESGSTPPEGAFAILHGLFWLTLRLAERAPLVVVVDDGHWVDEPSLRWLAYLVGRIADQPVGVVLGTRSGQEGEGGLLLDLLSDPAASVLSLSPLGEAAVASLVRTTRPDADDGFCRRCRELTAGNPFQLRALLAALAADSGSPARLEEAAARAASSLSRTVLRRLRALSADAQELARAVAVFEGDVSIERAAELAGVPTAAALAAVDELARADIVTRGEQVEFVHPLLREAVYESLGRHGRAERHRRAAALLTTAGAPIEQVATHLLGAAPAGDEAAVKQLEQAAAVAVAQGAARSAVAYLERALREPPPARPRQRLLAALGRAQLLAGIGEATETLRSAIEQEGDARSRAALELDLGRALHDFGRLEEACSTFERGTADLEHTVDADDLLVELEAWYLTSAMLLPGRAQDAHRQVTEILRRAGQAKTPSERVLVSKAMVMSLYAGEPAEPLIGHAEALWANGRLIEEGGLETQSVGHVMAVLSYCDHYGLAADVMARAEAASRRRGYLTWFAAAEQLRARQLLWTGPIDAALEDARGAVEIFSAGGQLYLPASLYCLVRTLIEHDEPDEAEAALRRLEPGAVRAAPFRAWLEEAGGRLAAARGDHAAALRAQLACGEALERVAVVNPAMFHWRSEAGLAALKQGDRQLAQALLSEEVELAERFGAPRAIGVARRAAGSLLRGEDAVEALAAAVRLLDECGARVEHALALVELGAATRRAGRPVEARRALREAIGVAEAVDARRIERLAREELALAGGRAPARRDRSHLLTPSERRVANLAAAGASNREIANELFVTVKAVEWHLANAYRRLGISRRTELTAALAGLDAAAVAQ